MLWAISCTDKPNTAAIRERILQPHRDYLQTITRMRKGQWNPGAAEGA